MEVLFKAKNLLYFLYSLLKKENKLNYTKNLKFLLKVKFIKITKLHYQIYICSKLINLY